MDEFFFNGLPSRVVFGAGSLARLGDEIERLGAKRALVLSTPEQRASAEDIARRLGAGSAGIFDRAAMHVPITVAEDARRVAQELNADCCVAVGGGSTIGLGKAIALVSPLPIVAIPTTYAGSEVTPIFGITQNGLKKTGRDMRVLPKCVIYDPTLTLTLPAALSATSGMNAIAHAVEGLYAQDANPVISLIAEEGIRVLARALPKVVANPTNIDTRSDALYGAWLCGIVLGSVGVALHHKLCHTLGGTWNLPHAETHTIVLPHATAYNREAAPEAMKRIARALGSGDAAMGLYELAQSLHTPLALKDIDMPGGDQLERAAKLATENPYWNPRPVEYNSLLELIQRAWAGLPPVQVDRSELTADAAFDRSA